MDGLIFIFLVVKFYFDCTICIKLEIFLTLFPYSSLQGSEGPGTSDEIRESFENSEDERRLSKIGNLKKKAINASNKFTHSLKKRGKRKIDYRVPSVSIEDVRDAKEESAVHELRQKLLERNLLPFRLDDYHTLLRFLLFLKAFCFTNVNILLS